MLLRSQARLFAHQLMQIFDEAEQHNNRRPGQADEEESGEKAHAEMKQEFHASDCKRRGGFLGKW